MKNNHIKQVTIFDENFESVIRFKVNPLKINVEKIRLITK